MKKYSGFKIVNAEPQTKPDPDGVDEDGYKVVYPDGYTSWSPKDAFENAYVEIDKMDFAHALALAKQGHRVYRVIWPESMNMFHSGKHIMVEYSYSIVSNVNIVQKNINLEDINATDWKMLK